MNTCSDINPLSQLQRSDEFFLARQPILNRDQALFAYELLFRRAGFGSAEVIDDLSATASVIAHASELGLETVIGTSFGFVNVDAGVLMSDFVSFLPADKVVLEILETVVVTDEIVSRVAELAQAGYTFALDDVIEDSDGLQRLLPFATIIKIDIMGMADADLVRLSGQFVSAGKKLLAEKVETIDEFKRCLGLGFSYFQGYYFAKPVIIKGRKLSPSQMSILKLMSQIVADAPTAEIEITIKHEAALSFNLLRMVNSVGVGVTHRVDSLSQALMVLGRRQFQRWLQILLYAEPGKASFAVAPLLAMATTRGKLLELIVQRRHPSNRNMADTAFTVGIMSLMDTLFGLPMDKILDQISVVDEVSDALLTRSGYFGDMLKLAEYLERIDECAPLMETMLTKLELTSEELIELQVAAYEWSESISRNAR
jgi:EAL and modified HD-GYP domain-containing signal transduction protein